MPTRRDNDEEHIARIQALMDEYRVNHEHLKAYVKAAEQRTREAHEHASAVQRTARAIRTKFRRKP